VFSLLLAATAAAAAPAPSDYEITELPGLNATLNFKQYRLVICPLRPSELRVGFYMVRVSLIPVVPPALPRQWLHAHQRRPRYRDLLLVRGKSGQA
jgi:hypothetical protein